MTLTKSVLQKPLKHSLVARAALVMGSIIGLAIASMLASMLIADSAQNDAARINLAGSLRMQAYRIATNQLSQNELPRQAVIEFENRLNRPILAPYLLQSDNLELVNGIKAVQSQWLALKTNINQDNSNNQWLSQIDPFVVTIDQLVALLEQQTEGKIQLLRLTQGSVLFLTLLIAFIALYEFSNNVVQPLNNLVQMAKATKDGNFDHRIDHHNDDELGVLATSFNEMAENLSSMYQLLETRVNQKTAKLEATNEALKLLYDSAKELSSGAKDINKIEYILKRLEQTLNCGQFSVCLSKKEAKQAYRIQAPPYGHRTVACIQTECAVCREETLPDHDKVTVFPLLHGEHEIGQLFVQHARDCELEPFQQRLLQTTADTIAAALSLEEQKENTHRLILMEERAVIARELHDSLAQSLSYLKMQVSRLQLLKKKGATEAVKEEAIADIKQGINSAYRQLRELLATFRLQLDDASLKSALLGTAAEFSERCRINIKLHYQLTHIPLSPNEEIHILQVVREALSNIHRHAQASEASIHLTQSAANFVSVLVKDNGQGLKPTLTKDHYGLTIMNERASSLHGHFELKNNTPTGVIACLEFIPAFIRKSQTAAIEVTDL